MARKSRKYQPVNLDQILNLNTVGYIRLSVSDANESNSIENQKLIIEQWGNQQQIPIAHFYVDDGYSGTSFNRPAFKEMIQDIHSGKISCVVVKDLSRLGRDYITTGYYIEVFFPSEGIRFVSVNDHFDTIDGITNQNSPLGSSIRVPIINAFNEQISIDIKKKVKEALDMKAQQGIFIGPRAPFGYQKSELDRNTLVPDSAASIVVRKIFELASSGIGVNDIVRYLNEKEIPTPVQFARSNGLNENNNGDESWNSRSVKYILTNRTYTGMLIQGKEKRVVAGTHEALVDVNVFDSIQKSFQARAFNLAPKDQLTENLLKGKVICGCCGGKMQRRRGTNHADWYFFTCITNNRLGAGRCTGMYIREEDIFSSIYYQLKLYIKEHFISTIKYKQEIAEYDNQIANASQEYQIAFENGMRHYEKFVNGEIDRIELRAALDSANELKVALEGVVAQKTTYEKQYQIFRKLLRVSDKELPLSEIMDCIDKITVCPSKSITVKWSI